jgi:zinc transport system ATP-binding protein
MFDVVSAGLGETGRLLARYHQASHRVAEQGDPAALREMDRLHHALDAAGAWQVQTRVETVLTHLGLDADAPFATASGGRKRQTLLARALVREPDVLVLDEPVAGVDQPSQRQFAATMARLVAQGLTVLVVLHELGELAPLVTRAVVLRHGRVVHDGAPPRPHAEHSAVDHDHVHPHPADDMAPRRGETGFGGLDGAVAARTESSEVLP